MMGEVKQNSLKAWFLAARPKTLTSAMVPVMAGVAMAFGVAGQMLTPTHVCLIVTVDYFKADLLATLKPVLFAEIIMLTIFSAYTWLTW